MLCYFIIIILFLQRNPSFLRGQTKNGDLSQTRSSMIGLPSGACPLGTVPIRRATKEDLIESKLLLKNIQPQAAKEFNRYVSSPSFILGCNTFWAQLVS